MIHSSEKLTRFHDLFFLIASLQFEIIYKENFTFNFSEEEKREYSNEGAKSGRSKTIQTRIHYRNLGRAGQIVIITH